MVPAPVSCTPPQPRCSSGVPTTCSSRRICWLRVGWAMNIFSAACVKLPASATAAKYRRCRNSMACDGPAAPGSPTSSAFDCAMATPFGRAKMRYFTLALPARRAHP